MNPLSKDQQPQIYANGMFSIKGPGPNWHPEFRPSCIFKFTIERLDTLMSFRQHPNACDCKLVARPIMDMTADEKQSFYEVCNYYPTEHDQYEGYKDWVLDLHKNDEYLEEEMWDEVEEIERFSKENTPAFLYLLSIGVYPKDQRHFNDNTVIDITNVRETV